MDVGLVFSILHDLSIGLRLGHSGSRRIVAPLGDQLQGIFSEEMLDKDWLEDVEVLTGLLYVFEVGGSDAKSAEPNSALSLKSL
jgi:hypothetical protein